MADEPTIYVSHVPRHFTDATLFPAFGQFRCIPRVAVQSRWLHASPASRLRRCCVRRRDASPSLCGSARARRHISRERLYGHVCWRRRRRPCAATDAWCVGRLGHADVCVTPWHCAHDTPRAAGPPPWPSPDTCSAVCVCVCTWSRVAGLSVRLCAATMRTPRALCSQCALLCHRRSFDVSALVRRVHTLYMSMRLFAWPRIPVALSVSLTCAMVYRPALCVSWQRKQIHAASA
jgi:hypothetical protein